jgi:hypothetical protein
MGRSGYRNHTYFLGSLVPTRVPFPLRLKLPVGAATRLAVSRLPVRVDSSSSFLTLDGASKGAET